MTVHDMSTYGYGAGTAASLVHGRCTECLRCVADCEFLKTHGTPKQIAARALGGGEGAGAVPFECSLCGLCDALCPEGISPSKMFLSLRGEFLAGHPGYLRRYAGFLRYERLGSSRLLSLYALPAGCDTVFFPGCNLPGTRPRVTEKLFRELAARFPRLGLVLDCCNRPSHDLGRAGFFREEFAGKLARLAGAGVGTLISACPNCHAVFKEYGGALKVLSVYEVMADLGISLADPGPESVIHDPCALRFSDGVSGAVRKLFGGTDLSREEMKHSRRRTLCCGEGGAVERARPEFSGAWRVKIQREAKGRRVITSCGGCQRRLSGVIPALHILDLWHDPGRALAGKSRASRMPMTYVHRFFLKLRLKRLIGGRT